VLLTHFWEKCEEDAPTPRLREQYERTKCPSQDAWCKEIEDEFKREFRAQNEEFFHLKTGEKNFLTRTRAFAKRHDGPENPALSLNVYLKKFFKAEKEFILENPNQRIGHKRANWDMHYVAWDTSALFVV